MDASSLNEIFFGNTVYEYLVALGIFVICLILVFIFKWLILRQLEKRAYATETSFDDLMVRIVRKGLVPVLFYGAFYMAVQGLTLPLSLAKLIDVLGVIALSVIGIMTTAEILEWAVETFWIRKDDQEQRLRSFRDWFTS